MAPAPICPVHLEKILVCTDGSPDSQGAFTGALALAQVCGSKIYLLRILTFNPELEAQAPELIARREAVVHDYLAACQVEANRMDVPLETMVRRRDTAYAAIVEEAQQIQPELIVMGRRGRSRLYRLMMGNVTARVIGYSPFNVLVVPQGVPLNFEQILIASDGSPHSYAAGDEALLITQRMGSNLLALSVARDEGELEMAEAIVKRLQKEAERVGVKLDTLVLQGRPYGAIIQAARDRQVDLIVMGVLGKTGLTSLLMGSVTERVIAQAPCAILVVKRVM